MNTLTAKQAEILPLICDGCSDRVIGVTLGISLTAAKARVNKAIRNAGAASRTQLAYQYGFEQGRKAAMNPVILDDTMGNHGGMFFTKEATEIYIKAIEGKTLTPPSGTLSSVYRELGRV